MSTDLSRFNPSGTNSPASPAPPSMQSSGVNTLHSNFFVILAALLCGLICVLGLVSVARCAWIRRFATGNSAVPSPPANKGLKKKVLKSLPKFSYTLERYMEFSECAICLTEFAIGDEIKVLPQCSHGFHVQCIDTWLGSHSSCPSCRQIPVVTRCHKCGELPVAVAISSSAPRDYHLNAFLP